jgi:hypothetical protein
MCFSETQRYVLEHIIQKGNTWLGVYNSVTDAQASHNEVQQYTQYTNSSGNIPYSVPADDIQQGRCLLITYDAPTSGYCGSPR